MMAKKNKKLYSPESSAPICLLVEESIKFHQDFPNAYLVKASTRKAIETNSWDITPKTWKGELFLYVTHCFSLIQIAK